MDPTSARFDQLPLATLRRAPRNPKGHDLGALHQAYQRFGYVAPMIVDARNGQLVAGHGRLDALLQRKAEKRDPPEFIDIGPDGDWLVPVRIVPFKSDAEAEAYLLADNRLVELGGQDNDRLAELLKDLAAGPGLQGTGYDRDDLDDLLKELGKLNDREDVVPDPPKTPVTEAGDLWILGEHRLLCGDATKSEDVARVMQKQKAELMATDPPYGISLDGGWREVRRINRTDQNTQTDRLAGDDRSDWHEVFALSSSPVAYIWHSGLYSSEASDSLVRAGYVLRAQIIWVKPHGYISQGAYQWRHEPCWYAVKKGATANWQAGHDQDTVWEAASPRAAQTKATPENPKADHPTQKPVELFEIPIRNHTKPGGIVYEPFCGSGTQVIAAEKTERRARAIEISPAYCDVVVERWQTFTGRTASREKA